MAIRLFMIFQRGIFSFFSHIFFFQSWCKPWTSVSYHQKEVYAWHTCPATILIQRLGSAKCSFMEGAQEMKTTSKLKRLARLSAPEKAERTGTGHKFR